MENFINRYLQRIIMEDWFTVENITDDTFAISEYGHWEETHCYLLCGSQRAVLIDTGLGIANIRKVVDKLTNLPVTAVSTHVHWDHIGGHRFFQHIAVHKEERKWLAEEFPMPLQTVKNIIICKPCKFPKEFSIDNYQIYKGNPDIVFSDGYIFDLGNRQLTVIHTPGHSPGHCCFYEADRKELYSGDLIYKGCMDAFYPTTDPQQFYQSVKKIGKLDIERMFPAHHQLIIPVSIIGRVEKAFRELEKNNLLEQGKGVFDFGEFQIHI